ncbi:MAG: hypothetical protein ABIJ08_02745 [Nanoarchaeota archaeon]
MSKNKKSKPYTPLWLIMFIAGVFGSTYLVINRDNTEHTPRQTTPTHYAVPAPSLDSNLIADEPITITPAVTPITPLPKSAAGSGPEITPWAYQTIDGSIEDLVAAAKDKYGLGDDFKVTKTRYHFSFTEGRIPYETLDLLNFGKLKRAYLKDFFGKDKATIQQGLTELWAIYRQYRQDEDFTESLSQFSGYLANSLANIGLNRLMNYTDDTTFDLTLRQIDDIYAAFAIPGDWPDPVDKDKILGDIRTLIIRTLKEETHRAILNMRPAENRDYMMEQIGGITEDIDPEHLEQIILVNGNLAARIDPNYDFARQLIDTHVNEIMGDASSYMYNSKTGEHISFNDDLYTAIKDTLEFGKSHGVEPNDIMYDRVGNMYAEATRSYERVSGQEVDENVLLGLYTVAQNIELARAIADNHLGGRDVFEASDYFTNAFNSAVARINEAGKTYVPMKIQAAPLLTN